MTKESEAGDRTTALRDKLRKMVWDAIKRQYDGMLPMVGPERQTTAVWDAGTIPILEMAEAAYDLGVQAERDRAAQMVETEKTELLAAEARVTALTAQTQTLGHDLDSVMAELRVATRALESIANSNCCTGCQEAALVAKKALGEKPISS